VSESTALCRPNVAITAADTDRVVNIDADDVLLLANLAACAEPVE
jgi:hypothetical protein